MRARLALSIGMLLASASLFPATASEITGTAWFPIGPAPFTGSPEYCGGCSTDATGRASALAVNPFNPDDIYLGGANGGVWHTQDGGLSWEPISDDEPSLAIGAIALDECGPGGCNKIYAGTGENAIRRDTYPGLGLLVQDRLAGDPPFWLLRGGLVLGGGSIHNVVLDPGTSGSTKRLYVPGSPYLGGAVQFARLRITFGSRATGSTVRVFVGDAGPASTAVRAASGAIISGDITADATPVGGVPGSDQGAGAGIHYTDAVITFGP